MKKVNIIFISLNIFLTACFFEKKDDSNDEDKCVIRELEKELKNNMYIDSVEFTNSDCSIHREDTLNIILNKTFDRYFLFALHSDIRRILISYAREKKWALVVGYKYVRDAEHYFLNLTNEDYKNYGRYLSYSDSLINQGLFLNDFEQFSGLFIKDSSGLSEKDITVLFNELNAFSKDWGKIVNINQFGFIQHDIKKPYLKSLIVWERYTFKNDSSVIATSIIDMEKDKLFFYSLNKPMIDDLLKVYKNG